MDHDRLFKELLQTFFIEFVELFLPEVSDYLDKDVAVVPIDKEVFSDVTSGDKHEVDLLMKVKYRGEDACFLIHVENQASAQSDFPKRMFRYFARLFEKYDLPVYPVVIFSYLEPYRPEESQFEVLFPNKKVLHFEYTVIQLNRFPWRQFTSQANPVASALMAKMSMTPEERPRVKLECLRLLASLKLDPAHSKLIGGFVDSYLNLTAEELAQYERELAKLAPEEQTTTMVMVTSWEKQGILKGKESIVVRQLQRRFGDVPLQLTDRIDRLSSEQLDDLCEALLDFKSLAELGAWLEERQLE